MSAGLAGFVLLGVLATNLELVRSGVRITQYAEMDAQVRRALEHLGEDLRNARGIKWNSATDISLTVPDGRGGTAQVTYAWSAAREAFFLVPGADSNVTAGRIYLLEGLPRDARGGPGLSFWRFDRDGNPATSDASTKRIQVDLRVRRQARTMAAATQNAVSAAFTMRNKARE